MKKKETMEQRYATEMAIIEERKKVRMASKELRYSLAREKEEAVQYLNSFGIYAREEVNAVNERYMYKKMIIAFGTTILEQLINSGTMETILERMVETSAEEMAA